MTVRQPELVQLHVLGPLRVHRDGEPPDRSLITQPRRLAVLVYLALARPRGLHARDTLVALLWPDSDEARARHALRNALHALRHAVGDGVIVAAGDGQIGVDPERLRCDALDLEAAVAEKSWQRAVDAYAGEFLQGFHVSDAPAFEQWLAAERRCMRELARDAAAALAMSRRAAGDHAGALAAARRALELEPEGEVEMRRVLELAQVTGDRASALRAYEEFTTRMRQELDVEPSPETERAAIALRSAGGTAASGQAPAASNDATLSDAQRAEASDSMTEVDSPRAIGSTRVRAGPASRRVRRRVGAIAAVVVLVALTGVAMQRSALGTRPRLTLRAASDEESHRMALALGAQLPARWRADTVLLDRYLRAQSHMQFDRLIQARGEFRALTADAPRYAPGWAGLSQALSLSGFLDMPPRDASTLARASALRALALDSTLVQPQYALVAYDMFASWDLPLARNRLDSALARHPDDAELSNLLAAWERWNGHLDEAIALKSKTLAMKPASVFYAEQVGYNLYLAHRCADAADRFRHLAVDFDYASIANVHLYRALRCLGRDSDAIDALQQALRQFGDSANAARIDAAGSSAAREEARRAVFRAELDRRLQARHRSWMQASAIAESFAELGDVEGTLAWLDSMYVERSWVLHDVPFDPRYDFLRGDERFERIIGTLPWRPSLTFATAKPPRTDP